VRSTAKAREFSKMLRPEAEGEFGISFAFGPIPDRLAEFRRVEKGTGNQIAATKSSRSDEGKGR
jgi:hypothetical protein